MGPYKIRTFRHCFLILTPTAKYNAPLINKTKYINNKRANSSDQLTLPKNKSILRTQVRFFDKIFIGQTITIELQITCLIFVNSRRVSTIEIILL